MIERHLQLIEDIENSFTLKGYVWLNQLYQRSKRYMWVAFAATVAIPIIEDIATGTYSNFSYILACVVWFPAILFAFVAGGFHIATGSILKKLSLKYDMKQDDLTEVVYDVLNK